VIITYTKDGAVVDIEFDAVVRVVPTTAAAVTAHPVERGVAVNDHVRPEPLRLSVEAWVTNTPLKVPTTQMRGVQGSVRSEGMNVPVTQLVGLGVRVPSQVTVPVEALRFDGEFDRVRDVYQELRTIQEAGQAVSIQHMKQGGLEDYEDMVIVSLSAPRDAQSGSAVAFTFDAQKVRIVDTRRVKVDAPAKQKKKKGEQGKKKVGDDQPKKRDLLGQALERAQSFLGSN
jgi:hypothetical protein